MEWVGIIIGKIKKVWGLKHLLSKEISVKFTGVSSRDIIISFNGLQIVGFDILQCHS